MGSWSYMAPVAWLRTTDDQFSYCHTVCRNGKSTNQARKVVLDLGAAPDTTQLLRVWNCSKW